MQTRYAIPLGLGLAIVILGIVDYVRSQDAERRLAEISAENEQIGSKLVGVQKDVSANGNRSNQAARRIEAIDQKIDDLASTMKEISAARASEDARAAPDTSTETLPVLAETYRRAAVKDARVAVASVRDLPPLSGKDAFSDEMLSIGPYMLLQTLIDADFDRALQAGLNLKFQTFESHGSPLTDEQKRHMQALYGAYFPVLVDLQRRANGIRQQLTQSPEPAPTKKSELQIRLTTLQGEIDRLYGVICYDEKQIAYNWSEYRKSR